MCRLPPESCTWMAWAKEGVVDKEDGSDRGTQRDYSESHRAQPIEIPVLEYKRFTLPIRQRTQVAQRKERVR